MSKTRPLNLPSYSPQYGRGRARLLLTTESLEKYESLRNWWRGDVILQRKEDGILEEIKDSDNHSEVSDDEV